MILVMAYHILLRISYIDSRFIDLHFLTGELRTS